MAIYPIRVKKQSGRADSSSGGKDYHLVLVSAANGKCLFITRFGRKGTWGVGFNVARHMSLEAARRVYDQKHREKLDKAYDEILINTEVPCKDEAELRRALGIQYWSKIGKDNLEWLIPGVDASVVREETPSFVEAEGGAEYRPRQPRLVPETPKKVESAEDRVKTTPVWGMF